MGGAFDPYHRWLGISPKEQPPNHYRLLGIERYESDHDVIDEAADRQMRHVRTHQAGRHADLSQQLLSEISSARRLLLNDVLRHDYDAKLRASEPTVMKTAQPLAVKPLPVAQPLPAATPPQAVMVQQPVPAQAVPQSEFPSAHPATEQPLVFAEAKPTSPRHGGRRRKQNPLLPLLIFGGGGGVLLLVALVVLASAVLFAEPEVVSTNNPAPPISNRSNNELPPTSLPRPSTNTNNPPARPVDVAPPPPPYVPPPYIPPPDTRPAFPVGGIDQRDLHPVPAGDSVTASDLPQERAEPIVERVKLATVTVQHPNGQGTTGFIVDQRGWVITNYRFLAGARSATIGLGRLAALPVEGVLAANPRCDLVLLDVGRLHDEMTVAPLAPEPWGGREIVISSSSPDVASHFVSIGQAYGPMSGSLVRKTMETEEGYDLFGRRGYGEETDWVNVSVNSTAGRLGASIIDTQSRVVGVVTWVSSRDSTVASAVSVVEVHKLMQRVNGRTYPLTALDGETQIPPP